ncbi:hypothetical protein [Asticcacaulis sp. EMRT-3]|uniref:hypothetical protein n=1 Tax=Asticcacaulis sp. EMRT-3 TaxID=3040349 RepID=UPI0024AF88F3|nr:hypothetical protein [Asticcacaulis sp. EMRT-3]MDI7776527.1 hypothetical protein [Asticcacaulis sp. EMRT-3]
MKTLTLSLILLVLPVGAQAQTTQILNAATQARLQIVTAPLDVAHSAGGISGYATVIDPAPLLGYISDLSAASAAATASSAEATRTKRLSGNDTVSVKVAEAAAAQAAADQARVILLRQQIALQVGPAVARLASTNFARDLASGQAALVRVDTPSGRGQAGARSVRLHTSTGDVDAEILGPARTADGKLQSPGLIVVVRGMAARWLTTGLSMTAELYDGSINGLLIPNAALLRHDGQIFAYVKTAPTRFDRRLVQPIHVSDDGLIVNSGFHVGEHVVTQGASALYTATAAPVDGDD